MKSHLVCTLLIFFVILPAIRSTPYRKNANIYKPWAGLDFVSRMMGFYPPSRNRYSSNQFYYSDYGTEYPDEGDYLYDSFDYFFDEPYVPVDEYVCWYCW